MTGNELTSRRWVSYSRTMTERVFLIRKITKPSLGCNGLKLPFFTWSLLVLNNKISFVRAFLKWVKMWWFLKNDTVPILLISSKCHSDSTRMVWHVSQFKKTKFYLTLALNACPQFSFCLLTSRYSSCVWWSAFWKMEMCSRINLALLSYRLCKPIISCFTASNLNL